MDDSWFKDKVLLQGQATQDCHYFIMLLIKLMIWMHGPHDCDETQHAKVALIMPTLSHYGFDALTESFDDVVVMVVCKIYDSLITETSLFLIGRDVRVARLDFEVIDE
ncbi:hypothetical protein Tco_0918804 [Tanacetum coccineum]